MAKTPGADGLGTDPLREYTNAAYQAGWSVDRDQVPNRKGSIGA